MRIGTQEFDTKENTYIMGILNVTPDSFSDGGKIIGIDAALKKAEEMKGDGAAIIDVGGESTRPGYTPVSEDEEMDRILPVIEAIKNRIDIPISVDTYKSKVAEAAILAGADLINDIWGLKADPHMAEVIARHEVACCLMHNRNNTEYKDFMSDLVWDLNESVKLAKQAGIAEDKMILDPGIGFAKDYTQNLTAIRDVGKVVELGYPVLLGTSRKSVIGLTLDLPSDKRLEGTLVTTVVAVQNGCSFVRVHDVKENYRAIQMTKAIYRG
ncbi:MAG: dihydropteroate synthase [Agathobacter sp.]|nr:dihydropteroate synthase [Agathobacter sp.]MBQ6812648.1 dihydropteroate synthase [Agathobacter sp.]